MTARKLSDAEKQEILHLYRTTAETSSSLATQYGVSTSTVSRLLKGSLPSDEYETLIQQKRSLRSAEAGTEVEPVVSVSKPAAVAAPVAPEPEIISVTSAASAESPVERVKPILRRSRPSASVSPPPEPEVTQLEVPLSIRPTSTQPILKPSASKVDTTLAEAEVLKEILSQNVIEPEEEEEDLTDDLEDELDEDDDEEGFEDGDDQPFLVASGLKQGLAVKILPLEEAPIPRTCYLVVDRSAELIAPPLKEFGDLGQIPTEEVQAKTLPIFDNHRIAKRYSNPRTQRVIKLPDGRMLSKASSHLRAKGITRLLIDGQVYSLI